jgi:hypothetical protein
MQTIARVVLAVALGMGTLAPVAASAQSMPQSPSYQALWWNAPGGSEAGWGINITHQGDILFATWFTYDTDGSGMWLVMSRGDLLSAPEMEDPYGYGYGMGMMARTSWEYEGPLYRTRGPAFDAATFDSTRVAVAPVGSANFRFTDANNGMFTFTVNGVTRSKAITRDAFATMPTCEFGGAPSRNYQDLWWNSPAGSESGWGLNLTHQGDTIFATWFTYDASGKGMWLFMPSAVRGAGEVFTGDLFRTSGPSFDAPWDASKVKVTPVGTATLSFGDAANGTFTATVNGATRTRSITRQAFASPVTVCR